MRISIRKIKRVTLIIVITIVFTMLLFVIKELFVIFDKPQYKRTLATDSLVAAYNVLVTEGEDALKDYLKREYKSRYFARDQYPPEDLFKSTSTNFLVAESMRRIEVAILIAIFALAFGSLVFIVSEIFKKTFVKVKRPYRHR